MEFRLIYQGPLPSEKCEDRLVTGSGGYGRAKDKHLLRKHFHPQLRELWKQHRDLRQQAETFGFWNERNEKWKEFVDVEPHLTIGSNVKKYIELIADDHPRCGGRFVPLISEFGGFTCSLDILFLRRDNPGSLVENGGDIDNRIKVLFDGLRMPKTSSELGGLTIDPIDEDPFYCLLEDDRLVTKVSVTTDRLIVPQQSTEGIHDVHLVIHVTMVNPGALFAGGRLV